MDDSVSAAVHVMKCNNGGVTVAYTWGGVYTNVENPVRDINAEY
jgi:hypothetical protein